MVSSFPVVAVGKQHLISAHALFLIGEWIACDWLRCIIHLTACDVSTMMVWHYLMYCNTTIILYCCFFLIIVLPFL